MQRKYPQLAGKIKFHKISNGDFGRAMSKHTIYSLGNGATLPQEVKDQIDKKLDIKLNANGENSKIDGIVGVFPAFDEKNNPIVNFFRIVEEGGAKGFLVMLDERTGKQRAAVRYWQLDPDKPVYATLFEIEGMTEYKKVKNGTFELETETIAYAEDVKSYPNGILPSETTGVKPYEKLPILLLKSNDNGTSEFTNEIEGLIDALDFASSALCDDVTIVEGIYWILQNFGGQDSTTIKEIIELSKTVESLDGVAGAKSEVLESPYQAKQFLIGWLETRLNKALMLPDTQNMKGVTATEIMEARDPMDIEASSFEPQVIQLLEEILELRGIKEVVRPFKRRTLTNDTEKVETIATQLSSGWIDEEEAIKLDPTIPEDDKDDLILRVNLRTTGVPPDDVDEMASDVTGTEVTQEAEEVTGKTLTGIQTTSLIGVIEKLKEGSLSQGQAINIVSISIGVTKAEAKRIIEGLD